jgi:O-antigen/teichoic acid export membrane protein
MTSISPPTREGTVAESAAGANPSVAKETIIAIRNAALMTLSLVGTLGVAVAVRIWMPRFLGPQAFGTLHFAEELAAACLFFTTLGFEPHIRREVSIRPSHASEFFGGMVQLRLMATVVVFGAMAGLLWAMGKSAIEWELVYLFGLGQVAFVLNTSFASCLQATSKVTELAVINVASKVVWGTAIVLGLWLGGNLRFVALSFLVTEALKAPLLYAVCRKHLDLKLRFELAPVLAVMGFCMPYYLNQLTHEVYARTGVTFMSGMTNNQEVGWYGAANHVKTLVLLALPIINAVIMPSASRLAKESAELLAEMMRGAVRLVLSLAMPVAIVLAFNAGDIIHLLYSSEYAPAARNLLVLSAIVPLACYCVLSAMQLLLLGRIWAVTAISLAGLGVNLATTPLFIRELHDLLGPGGAGVGAGLAAVLTEATVALSLHIAIADRVAARQLTTLALRFAVVAAVLGLAHLLLASTGVFRLPLEALLCALVGTAVGAIPLRQILTQLRAVWRPSQGGTRLS